MKIYIFALVQFLLILLFLKPISIAFVQVLCYFFLSRLLWSCIVFEATFGLSKRYLLRDEVNAHNKAVFISGCDTGFGNQLAKRLDSKGFHVFAGCYRPSGQGASSLKQDSSERLRIVHLDVTKDIAVEQAADFVRDNLGSCELWAVVNNAGIHKGFSVEDTGIDEYRDLMEVNVFGSVRVTKAFLPMLKETKGRLVNVTSLIGRTVLPFFTPYCISKAAAVSLVDCLRQEIHQYGIQVISIEPEMFQTNLTKKSLVDERMNYTFGYGKMKEDGVLQRLACIKNLSDAFLYFASPNTEIVVNDMEKAVSSKYPNTTYTPRRNFLSRVLIWLYLVLPVDTRDWVVRVLSEILKRIF